MPSDSSTWRPVKNSRANYYIPSKIKHSISTRRWQDITVYLLSSRFQIRLLASLNDGRVIAIESRTTAVRLMSLVQWRCGPGKELLSSRGPRKTFLWQSEVVESAKKSLVAHPDVDLPARRSFVVGRPASWPRSGCAARGLVLLFNALGIEEKQLDL